MAQTQSPWKQTTVYSVRNESYLAELRGRRSRPAVKAVKQRTRSAISIRNQIEHRERRHAIRVNVVGQERKIEKDRNNRVRGVRHFNQGRGRCRDNDQRGKSDRHPRNAANATEGTALVAKVGVAAKTTNADRMEQHMHRNGRRPTYTYDHRNNFPREERCTEEPSSHSRRECPDDAKKVCTRITERCCILAANVCSMEINKCMQTERGSIRNCAYETNN